jgi:hypothetical protein
VLDRLRVAAPPLGAVRQQVTGDVAMSHTRSTSAGVESTSDDGYLIFCSSGVWTLFRE